MSCAPEESLQPLEGYACIRALSGARHALALSHRRRSDHQFTGRPPSQPVAPFDPMPSLTSLPSTGPRGPVGGLPCLYRHVIILAPSPQALNEVLYSNLM